jgi:hypothetical protein
LVKTTRTILGEWQRKSIGQAMPAGVCGRSTNPPRGAVRLRQKMAPLRRGHFLPRSDQAAAFWLVALSASLVNVSSVAFSSASV